jgi:hypothetical protein
MNRLLILLALAASTPWLPAASVNDSYASRSTLLVGPPDTASNVGATLEPSEPVPAGVSAANYQATLWWEFTPTISGWYEINTAGSDGDTILAVWSGGSASDFTSVPDLVQVNDEAAEGKVSRVWLNASNTVTYKIAVAAKGAVRGNVKLRAFFIPDPFAQVNAISLSSSSMDVTSAAANASATLGISATREITSGSFSLVAPDGQVVVRVPLSAAQRTAGNVASGTYVVNFTVPRYIKPGEYAWSVSLDNTVRHLHSSQGREALIAAPDGSATGINVQNSGAVDTYGLWMAKNTAALNGAGGAQIDLGGVLGSRALGGGGGLGLHQFAFGIDPAQGNGAGRMVLSGSTLVSPGMPLISAVAESGGSAQRLKVQFVRRMNDSALSYVVQFSNDLATWTDSAASPGVLGDDGTFQALEVQDTLTTADTPHRFARVKVGYALP